MDNLYNGQPFDIALLRVPADACGSIEIRIMPLRRDHVVCLPKNARPSLSASAVIAEILQIECIELIQTMAALNSDADAVYVAASPAGAVGYPSRDPNLDAFPGFASPPLGYGEVAFYWWLGDPLTKDRISWQLERLRGMPVSGLQVNYAYSDTGRTGWWGLPIPAPHRCSRRRGGICFGGS